MADKNILDEYLSSSGSKFYSEISQHLLDLEKLL